MDNLKETAANKPEFLCFLNCFGKFIVIGWSQLFILNLGIAQIEQQPHSMISSSEHCPTLDSGQTTGLQHDTTAVCKLFTRCSKNLQSKIAFTAQVCPLHKPIKQLYLRQPWRYQDQLGLPHKVSFRSQASGLREGSTFWTAPLEFANEKANHRVLCAWWQSHNWAVGTIYKFAISHVCQALITASHSFNLTTGW